MGRLKLEDETDEFWVSMTDFNRLSDGIAWIDLSFVERDRIPRWAIELESIYKLGYISLRGVYKFSVITVSIRVSSLSTTGS